MLAIKCNQEMQVKYNFLFNFSVSYTGGGLKRLHEYAKWFNENGGANFIVHPNCEYLISKFKNNNYFVVKQNKTQRLFDDCAYLKSIMKEIKQPDLYYSYGIPVYSKFGKIDWFHLSNVLPLHSRGVPLSFFGRFIKFKLLARKIKNNYKNADVIAAESNHSLGLVKIKKTEKLFLSVNGSNDELAYLKTQDDMVKEDIATVVGTYGYKAIADSYQIFKMLKNNYHDLKLVIIGNKATIPEELKGVEDIIITGVVPQSDVIDYLKKSKYYISTTRIENSFNAASEGIVFADESYISDIGPHRELLLHESYETISIPNLKNSVLHVKKEDISGKNMKSWGEIITDIINKVKELG